MKAICETTAPLPNIDEIIHKTDDKCPVAWALEVVRKARKDSCGKGVMCRDGLHQLDCIISDIVRAKGQDRDVALMVELCEVIIQCNECPISVETASLVLASLNNHTADWDLHIRRKACNELVCYFTIHISAAGCTGCGECVSACPQYAISGGEGLIHVVDQKKCNRCCDCIAACRGGFIQKAGLKKPAGPQEPVPVGSFTGAGGLGLRRRKRPSISE